MIKKRRFPKIFFGWWIALASGIVCFWGQGFHIFGFSALFKPIASGLGLSRAAISVAASIGRLEGGFAADRLKKQHLRFLLAGSYSLQVIGFTTFLLNQTLPMAYLVFILHHLSMGIYAPLNSVIFSRYFGRKAYGSIRGTLMMFITPVSVVAPIYAGWVFDTTGSYITVFILCAVLLTLSAIIMSLAFPPKPPAQVTDIHEIL